MNGDWAAPAVRAVGQSAESAIRRRRECGYSGVWVIAVMRVAAPTLSKHRCRRFI